LFVCLVVAFVGFVLAVALAGTAFAVASTGASNALLSTALGTDYVKYGCCQNKHYCNNGNYVAWFHSKIFPFTP